MRTCVLERKRVESMFYQWGVDVTGHCMCWYERVCFWTYGKDSILIKSERVGDTCEKEREREREWDKEHFLQRLQPSSLSASPLQAPEWTDGGGGVMKGQTDERRERWRRTWRRMGTRQTRKMTCHSRVEQNHFLKQDNSSSSSLHLSLQYLSVCTSVIRSWIFNPCDWTKELPNLEAQ